MNHENINDDQIRWEFLKYEVRKFSRRFSKTLAKELREELQILQNKSKLYEHKFFLNLEKNSFVWGQIYKLMIKEKELTEQNEINNNIFTFYEN